MALTMPLVLNRATPVSWSLRPQDLLRLLHGPCGQESHFRCLPRKFNKDNCRKGDAVRKLTDDIEQLDARENLELRASTPKEKQTLHMLSEDVQKQLHFIMGVIKELSEEKERPVCPAQVQAEDMDILDEFMAADLPAQLLAKLNMLEFEARKDVMNVCCALLWVDLPDKVDRKVLEYIKTHRFFPLLLEGYKNEDAALHCGVILRSCLRHDELVQAFLDGDMVFDLISYAKHPSMDISQDALCSLREVLLDHRAVSAPWVNAHYEKFFEQYNTLLDSTDYLVVRSALTLLAYILLNWRFKSSMESYIEDDNNLRNNMNLLRDSSKVIQLDAFHVFQSFVNSPNKAPKVQQILYKNKEKLIALVEELQPSNSRLDDDPFVEAQRTVIDNLRALAATTLKRVTTKDTIFSVDTVGSAETSHSDHTAVEPVSL